MSSTRLRSTIELPEFAVETRALTKIYPARHKQPERKALDSVSLAVPRGSFFGLLGPTAPASRP